MKHKHNILVMSAALAVAPFALSAQTDVQADEVQDSVYMVKTAFRSVAQGDLLGGVSVVNVEEMLEKNYTTYSLDHMESLVGGWNGKSIWGNDEGVEHDSGQGYLVLIDGIPRDANNVQPSEIAQITFLKGANAVVLYGSRAAKGVILITTKRGQAREGLKIDLNVNTGFDVIKELPEYLGAAEYMKYYNQAKINDWYEDKLGVDYFEEDLPYPQEEIDKTNSGVNPYRYVDVDYYSSDYIKKVKSRKEAVLELSGGNSRARLYGNINAYTQNDFVKLADAKDTRINRLSVRGNVDIDFNDFISGHLDANATFYDSKHRQYSSDPAQNMTYWRMASTSRPNYPNHAAPLIPLDKVAADAEGRELVENTSNIFDGCFLGGTSTDQSNVISQIYAGGELKWTSRQFQFDGGLNFNLGKLLEGLTLRTNFGMDFKASYNTRFDPKYAVFKPDWGYEDENGNEVDDEMIHKITQINTDEVTGQKKLWGTKETRTMALSFQFDYVRSFGDHNVSAILLGNGFQQTIDGQYHNTTNANLGFDLSYNFAHRFYAQFSAAEVHSAKLAEGHRNAFSPSLTLGWNLARESFLDGSIFDDLLISASVSQLNEDMDVTMMRWSNNQWVADRYYLYNGNWEKNTWGFGWADGKSTTTITPSRGENAKLEMIKRKEVSFSLRTSMFERFINAEFTFFKNRWEGYLVNTTEEWPNHMQKFIPYLNNDVNSRQGFDFAVNFNKDINEVGVSLGVVGTYYDTKVVTKLQSELDKENQSQLDREGKPIDAIWGYKNLGFFQSVEEIESAPEQKIGDVRPGDLRYADLSNNGAGDTLINSNDMVYLGKEGRFGAPFTMGVNLTVKYKNFTFYALGSAKAGAYARKNNSYYQPKGNDKYSVLVRDTWTPENTDAKYPALTTSTSGSNNYAESDFWLYKDNAFKLTKIQLTYDLPKELLGDSFVKGVSAFVSGKDLLTISKERKVMETSIGGDPQTRFFQVGVKATF
jgi:TonB-linked SusC/RagA family outer membrane protein